MANRTTLVDNNTWNNTHIATVGRAMASSEQQAYPILASLDVDYIVVVFGGLVGYTVRAQCSGRMSSVMRLTCAVLCCVAPSHPSWVCAQSDDINKFLWMVRIGGGVFPDLIQERNYFSRDGQFTVGDTGAAALHNCLLYKMCYYRFDEVRVLCECVACVACVLRVRCGRVRADVCVGA